MSNSDKIEGGVLTIYQREFMFALQNAVNKNSGPVTINQVVYFAEKSDSRVRAHIKKLIGIDFVCCVGKTRYKKYVPSMRWLKEPGICEDDCVCIGGFCQLIGCGNLSVSCWRGMYLCRDCLMGSMNKKDPYGRDEYYKMLGSKSPAGWDSTE